MGKMKDSEIEWIGLIPEDWNLKRLKFCLNERNNKNFPVKTEQVLSLVKDKGVMLYEDKGNQGNKAKEDVSQYKLAYPNTLIVNSMNILIGSVGISDYFGCVSPVYYVFEETFESDIRYINYIFNTREFQKELRKYANGIMEIRLRISSSDIFKRKIPLPDKKIQSKIADFLDKKCEEIDLLYSDIEKQVEILEEYKKSVITEQFKESGFCRLKNIGCFQNGVNFNNTIKDEMIKFLGVGDFKDNFILNKESDFSETPVDRLFTQNELLKSGDIVFVRSNGSKELVGRSIMVEDVNFPLTYSGFCIRFRNGRKDILNKYLLYFFRSYKFKEALYSGSMGTAINNLSQGILGNIKIPIVDIEEQKIIIEKLDNFCINIDEAICGKKEQLEVLEQYKKSLIYEYVTGKKEVPV